MASGEVASPAAGHLQPLQRRHAHDRCARPGEFEERPRYPEPPAVLANGAKVLQYTHKEDPQPEQHAWG